MFILSRKKLKFLSFFIIFVSFYMFLPFAPIANAQSIPALQVYTCNWQIGPNIDVVEDVKCRCPKNQCRLSTRELNGVIASNVQICNAFTPLLSPGLGTILQPFCQFVPGSQFFGSQESFYGCVNGSDTIDGNTFRLGQEDNNSQIKDNYHLFKDSNVYSATNSGGEALKSDSSVVYTDIFAQDVNRVSIPRGSVCKLDPESNTAYWYYPTYFEVLQGKKAEEIDVTGVPNIFGAGGTCDNVLFSSYDLYGNAVSGTQTFFGCLPNSTNGLVAFIVRLITGLSIVITLIIIAINLIQIISNSTNSDIVSESQQKMTSAVITLVIILLTLTILNIIGIQIIGLGSDGAGGSIFRFFTGG